MDTPLSLIGSHDQWAEVLLALLESSTQQGEKIRRLEDVIAAQPSAFWQQKQLQAPLALSVTHDINQVQLQLQQLQDSQKTLQDQQAVSNATVETLRKLEQRVKKLEQQGQVQQQLCLRAAKDSTSACAMEERMQRLEQQIQCLAESAADSEGKRKSSVSGVRVLRDELHCQLDNVRTDTKQALAIASSNLHAELQAAAEAKAKETERQFKRELEGLTARLDSRMSNTRLAVTSAVSTDIDARLAAAHEAAQQRLDHLQAQIDRLADGKADMLLLIQYTEQVSQTVDKLSSMVVDSTQTSIADLANKQDQLRREVQSLSASKADSSALLQHQQHCQRHFLELQRTAAAAQSTAKEAAAAAATAERAADPVEGLRLRLADTQGCVAALQAANAGLESTSSLNSSQLQQHSTQLHDLASTYHMLQQQLLALTNQIDPSAAAVLAAAAAGDKSAAAEFCALMGTSSPSGVPVLDCLQDSTLPAAAGTLADRSCTGADNSAGSSLCSWVSRYLASESSSELAAATERGKGPGDGVRSSSSGGCAAAAGKASVLRHLPVAARLLLLENGLQELCTTVAHKGSAGDLQSLSCQVEGLATKLAGIADGLRSLSNSTSKQLDDHTGSLMRLTASLASLDDQPSQDQVYEMLQQGLADAHGAASAVATATSKAAVAPLQQQLDNVAAELQEAKARLHAAMQELDQLKDWQLAVGDKQHELQQQAQQMKQHLSKQLRQQQQELQQQFDSSREAVQQLQSDRAAFHSETKLVSALDSKLRLLSAEVDRLDGQAATTAQAQDELRKAIAAQDAALGSHSNARTAELQQLRQDCATVVSESQEVQPARLAALEKAASGQATAVAELAGLVAGLPSKDGIRDAVLGGSQAAAAQLLKEHKQEEQARWEVWLAEFARLMEQRPTKIQIQQQLAKQQQHCDQQCQQHLSSCRQLAAQTAETVVADALASAWDEGVATQLRVLDMRLDTVEAGLQTLGEAGAATGPAAHMAYAAHRAVHSAGDVHRQLSQAGTSTAVGGTAPGTAALAGTAAYASGQVALLLRQVGDVQLQLLSKVDRADVEQQLVIMRQALQGCVQQEELEAKLEQKVDLEVFLASVAARQKTARDAKIL